MILLLLDNHTVSETTSRKNKIKIKQSYNKPKKKKKEKKKKGNKKGKKKKIHNTQCQITNLSRYNISKWEEFKNNSCSFHWGTERIMDLVLKRLKRGNPAPSMPWGPLHKRGSISVKGQRSCHGNRRAPTIGVAIGTNQEREDEMDALYSNLAQRKGVRSLTGPRLKKVPRLIWNTTQSAEALTSKNSLYLPNYWHLCRNL